MALVSSIQSVHQWHNVRLRSALVKGLGDLNYFNLVTIAPFDKVATMLGLLFHLIQQLLLHHTAKVRVKGRN